MSQRLFAQRPAPAKVLILSLTAIDALQLSLNKTFQPILHYVGLTLTT